MISAPALTKRKNKHYSKLTILKKLTLTLAFSLIGFIGFSQTSTYVNPYVKQNGTVVQGYQRTMPNNTNTDNYSTQGNSNP